MYEEYEYFIYIMVSISKVLYVRVTNDIYRRVLEHKQGVKEDLLKNMNVVN